jgi:hypothetical protein
MILLWNKNTAEPNIGDLCLLIVNKEVFNDTAIYDASQKRFCLPPHGQEDRMVFLYLHQVDAWVRVQDIPLPPFNEGNEAMIGTEQETQPEVVEAPAEETAPAVAEPVAETAPEAVVEPTVEETEKAPA